MIQEYLMELDNESVKESGKEKNIQIVWIILKNMTLKNKQQKRLKNLPGKNTLQLLYLL